MLWPWWSRWTQSGTEEPAEDPLASSPSLTSKSWWDPFIIYPHDYKINLCLKVSEKCHYDFAFKNSQIHPELFLHGKQSHQQQHSGTGLNGFGFWIKSKKSAWSFKRRVSQSGPRCVARFDFEGEHGDELTFSEGDVIQLKAYVGQDWARGQLGTLIGIFPLNFVEVIEDLPPPPSQQHLQPNKAPEAAKPAQVRYFYKRPGRPLHTSHRFCLFYQQLRHVRRLVPNGWWLCMTLLEIRKETCPFSRVIAFWSAGTLMVGGAAVTWMAGRGFSPQPLLRAQVWRWGGDKCLKYCKFLIWTLSSQYLLWTILECFPL